MKLKDFLQEKLGFIFSQLFVILFITGLFQVIKVGISASIFSAICIIVFDSIIIAKEYIKKREFYNTVFNLLDVMEKKCLISGVLDEPDFLEGKLLVEVVRQTNKAMNDEIAMYKIAQNEYRDYIDTWIHEIKIPIACIGLICENNKNEITKSINDETLKIDAFVEQALFYARSTALEKDYVIREINLDKMIKSTIKKYSKQLIQSKADIKMDNLDVSVYTDTKWLDFILGQLITNSIKYKNNQLIITFKAKQNNEQIFLFVSDNGIGITRKDISRIFDKGFTGENGRKYAKSTGIGLYLCKQMCSKMHLGLTVNSEFGRGSTFVIVFPKDKAILLEN